MKIYLSGPMTGLPDNNFPAFMKEAERLRAMGYEVINPAEIEIPEGADWKVCMRLDIQAMMEAEILATLPGWEKSRGANIEVNLAKSIGILIVEASGLVNATSPTVNQSLTVAPDPGEGWRLIDKEKDHPQEGDEYWDDWKKVWKPRPVPRQSFGHTTHYRRRIEDKPRKRYPDVPTMLRDVVGGEEGEAIAKEVEADMPKQISGSSLPPGLPPLPEGAVYLGKGGTFQAPKAGFRGWYWFAGDADWRQEHDEYFGTGTSAHFAAPALNSARAGFEDLVYFVRCPNCGARGPVLEDNVEAITLWNKPARDEEVRP